MLIRKKKPPPERGLTDRKFGRHSFCIQVVQDGVDIGTAQSIMRHNDLQSTLRCVHADSERHREAVNLRGRGSVVKADFKMTSK